ncbi:MAG TPA: BrnA antitoxin family protein [Candidatus Aphodousia faecigallinarum]|uniref:BrnA antitoxin family protein n=1 Tax=Candidatus Aphodousia faecigallinarum TaxID=2840677 RepID=A0A9D1IHA5_9BURK|nr:BrnA antitoxin family protein [Candidatus Aphodousia faecigallinarum]
MTTVTFELKNKKPMTEEERRRLLDIRDEDIDYSDIAQIPDNFADEAVRGLLYRPVKKSISIRIDADVLIWLKSQGKGYQTRINTILRQAMLKELKV